MRALVIGADGFAGRWLLRHLLESGDEVVAAVGPHFGADLPGDLTPHPIDVRVSDTVTAIVGEARAEVIYYLAGISRAGARDDIHAAIGVSVVGAMNVLAAAAGVKRRPRLLHVGSSHMYEVPSHDRSMTEATPLHPSGAYGAAKAAAEVALLQLGPSVGIEVLAARAFNHIGPGQHAAFVVPSLAQQIARIRSGEIAPTVRLGNAEIRRDFTDVRDVVRAYRLLATLGRSGEAYNVASGTAVSIREVAHLLLGLAEVEAEVRTDPALVRSDDPPVITGDSGKLRAETGWEPEIVLKQTLADMLAGAAVTPRGRTP